MSLTKRDVRTWFRTFFVRPHKRWEQVLWLWDKAIYGSMASLLAFATREAFVIVVILAIVTLVVVYEFLATGR